MKAVSEGQKSSTVAVLILGMHRSGTSAITGAIKALGFGLGDKLMAAKPDNVKGFWEDWDIVNLNEKMLRSDTGSWDRLSLFDMNSLSPEELGHLVNEATELLEGKFSGVTRFAIKDPRLSLTLPVWRAAFTRRGIKPYHILCLRHPSSVALSLASRNAMPAKKALLLWLTHTYSILRDCRAPLMVVGYESLLSDPVKELRRVAQFLGVADDINASAMSNLSDQFLDERLNHFGVDARQSCDWLVLVDELFQALLPYQDSAALTLDQQVRLLDKFCLDDQLLTELTNSVAADQREHILRRNLEALTEENQTLKDSVVENSQRLLHLESDNAQAAAELSKLRAELAALEADRAKLDLDRQRIDVERIKLLGISDAMAKDKRRLEHDLAASQETMANLSRINEEVNAAHKSMEAELRTMREEVRATKHLHERMSGELRELRLIRASRIWRITAPLRWILDALHRLPGISFILQHRTLTLQPIHDLEPRSSHSWTSIDRDAQFLLGNNRYPIRPGSYQVKVAIKEGVELLAPFIYFDYGAGFRQENSVALSLFGHTAKALITLTDPVYQLRLDPCETTGTFAITAVHWRPISKPEALIRLIRHVIQKNRARGLTLAQIITSALRKAKREGWANIWRNTERYFRTEEQVAPNIISYDRWIDEYENPYGTLRYGDVSGTLSVAPFPVIVFDSRHDAEGVTRTIHSLSQQHAFVGPVLLLSPVALPSNPFEDSQIQQYQESNQYASAVAEFIGSLGNIHCLVISAGNALRPCFFPAVGVRLLAEPNARLVYSDSDMLGDDSRRRDPEFKPEWNPDFQLAAHYVGDTFVIAAELISQLPLDWVRHGNDALYGLLASAIPLLTAQNAVHIPEVLWHKTGAANAPAKFEAIRTILAGVNLSPAATALEDDKNSRGYRLHYHLPAAEPAVDIIIPTKDQLHLLRQCIDSIRSKTHYSNYRIVVVDNGSTERNTQRYLDELRNKAHSSVLSYPYPFNYSAINNLAVTQSNADVVVLMNNDVEVISPNWLREMVSHAMRREVGCVGAKLYYPDGRIQHAGVILGIHGVAGHCFRLYEHAADGYLQRLRFVQNYSAVTGACLAVKRDTYRKAGGLNEQDLAVAFNDIDFCLKVREAGYRNVWTPYAELYHHESATRGEYDDSVKLNDLKREASYMAQRWGELLINDPAYNPNLSLSDTDFALSTRYVGGGSLRKFDTESSVTEHPYRTEGNIVRVNQVLKLSKAPGPVERVYRPGLSIVILTLEKLELIAPLLESLISAKRALGDRDGINLEIVVGDTGSRNEAVHALYQRLDDDITVVKHLNYHFSRCNNELFKEYVVYDTVLFLNNDIIFADPVHSLKAMYALLASDEEIAIVGTYLLYPNKRLQHGGVAMFDEGELRGLCYHPGHNTEFSPLDDGDVSDVPAVTGACLMMSSAQFAACYYFDEAYQAEAQDVDLCLKARRIGKSVKMIYCGEVIHYENATRPRGDANQRDRCRFIRKWRAYQEAVGFE